MILLIFLSIIPISISIYFIKSEISYRIQQKKHIYKWNLYINFAKEIEDTKIRTLFVEKVLERSNRYNDTDKEIELIKRDFGKYIPSLMVEIRDEKLNYLIDE